MKFWGSLLLGFSLEEARMRERGIRFYGHSELDFIDRPL